MPKAPLQLAQALGHEEVDKRLDILRRVGEVGSISEAARGAGLSYRAAWQAIDTLSNLAGTALLERAVGGSGGGGAKLTPAGEQLLHAAQQLSHAKTQVLATLSNASAASTAPSALPALGLRTSMRNMLPCTVHRLERMGAIVRVQLRIDDGSALASRITGESVELLGLRKGLRVLALCKATAVAVHKDAGTEAAAHAANQLRGTVSRVSRAASGGEVVLTLAGGLQMVGFAGPAHGLKAKQAATATLDESAVVLAVAQ